MADEGPSPQSPREALSRMLGARGELGQRILSGVAVAVIGLTLLYLGTPYFVALCVAVAAMMAWEWGRMVRGVEGDTATYVHIATVLGVGLLTAMGISGLGVAAAVVGAITVASFLIGSGQSQMSAVGVLYTSLPVVALGWLRSDEPLGFLATLFLILAVATTDIAAFAAGRTIGGAKLWPAVSPNKTWSGLVGGVTGAALIGALFPLITGSGSSGWLAFLGLILGLAAQAGDLFESGVKRHYGVKDTGSAIPGHGGFMDRMDGLVTASILAVLIAFAIDAYAPARALLYGS